MSDRFDEMAEALFPDALRCGAMLHAYIGGSSECLCRRSARVAAAIRKAVEAEREACAKVADDYSERCDIEAERLQRNGASKDSLHVDGMARGGESVALAIRARAK